MMFGGSPYERLLRPWDAQWYEHIAAHGYGFARHGRLPSLHYRDIAFFPLYPGLVGLLRLILPLSVPVLALLVSWCSALLAAWGIHTVVERLRDHRTATVLVLLWALLPHAAVLSVPYSESLLTACAAWGLWALLDGRWVWAGTCAALAGLARPNGAALAAAVILAGLWLARTTRALPAPRVLAGMALAPLGWFGYVLYVGWERGDVLGGYFAVQRDWGSTFDFGLAMLRYTDHIEIGVNRPERIVAVLLVSGALLLYALLLAERRRPLPGALLVYAGVLLLISVGGSAYLTCKPRFLLPAFPLLVPLADRLVAGLSARPGRALLVLASLAGPALLYGAYLVAAAPTAL
ncbi:membrane protein [Streptomyces sp. SPB074]|nr:membrane protein [Streptomyces sp. SPB074]